jgi:hypothetical protein
LWKVSTAPRICWICGPLRGHGGLGQFPQVQSPIRPLGQVCGNRIVALGDQDRGKTEMGKSSSCRGPCESKISLELR